VSILAQSYVETSATAMPSVCVSVEWYGADRIARVSESFHTTDRQSYKTKINQEGLRYAHLLEAPVGKVFIMVLNICCLR